MAAWRAPGELKQKSLPSGEAVMKRKSKTESRLYLPKANMPRLRIAAVGINMEVRQVKFIE
jgi:hypothetical protein